MELFPYQKTASTFLKERGRAYIALDMGMGKTITSLHAAHEAGEKHILLVAEKNEIVNSQNFKKEVENHFDGLRYINLRDGLPWEGGGGAPGDGSRTVCGINPDALVKLDHKVIASIFDTMIIDEATLAKTTTTARFKQVHKIAKGMDYLILLSGTPMMNGAAELYAPMLLMEHPMIAGKGAEGRKAFEVIFAGGHTRKIRNTGKWFQDYVWWAKGSNHVRELRYLLQDRFFILSKTETDVFKKKVRRVEKVEMSVLWLAEYMNAWNEYLKDARVRNVDMDNISELRNLIENGQCYQVNSRWKVKRIAEDIAKGVYGDRRIVVFTLFVESDQLLQEELLSRGVSFRTFEEVREWKEGTEQVLVGRIKAHGKGGNVPEASVALFADMDFVPANNIQAENRIDRPEQKNEMEIVYYITEGKDVVDSHVQNINYEKSSKITKFMKPMTEDELRLMPKALEALREKFPKEAEILGI